MRDRRHHRNRRQRHHGATDGFTDDHDPRTRQPRRGNDARSATSRRRSARPADINGEWWIAQRRSRTPARPRSYDCSSRPIDAVVAPKRTSGGSLSARVRCSSSIPTPASPAMSCSTSTMRPPPAGQRGSDARSRRRRRGPLRQLHRPQRHDHDRRLRLRHQRSTRQPLGIPLLTIDQPFGNHNGGALAIGPDGNLYIGVGDGGVYRQTIRSTPVKTPIRSLARSFGSTRPRPSVSPMRSPPTTRTRTAMVSQRSSRSVSATRGASPSIQ